MTRDSGGLNLYVRDSLSLFPRSLPGGTQIVYPLDELLMASKKSLDVVTPPFFAQLKTAVRGMGDRTLIDMRAAFFDAWGQRSKLHKK